MYEITVDPARKLIRAHLQGFFTVDEVEAFSAALQTASVGMGCRSGEHLTYVDTSQCALQTQEVVAAFQRIVVETPIKARRIALVTGGTLARMQTRRILVRDQAMMFDDAHEAERWLLNGDLRQQAA